MVQSLNEPRAHRGIRGISPFLSRPVVSSCTGPACGVVLRNDDDDAHGDADADADGDDERQCLIAILPRETASARALADLIDIVHALYTEWSRNSLP